ncbi:MULTISPECIES: ABC transporter ATP-binding protein [unclassified Arthrobacter]|uniref:ABC transporter ATP-binding protein n=1 Tax=unclassified Arthrobacter TaxID=235627 RepID=UPI001D15349A|nr:MULTISPECIES: ABC transporter ATP-binding protein [unclassified Arthrobacter]MCC3275714.1 ABC transporter ATP-binding protein [Arthrobacter sp. zg-Y20]MCC9177235.1 ABC transporter ATP-binding protein [Arthrobacter sp. zg-Y750]MDK1315871.1 ABC transporter ATP-binding protein [Arthrobacter sp. zg.Y20]WIB06344.1 ABC transporter ATP-binding protein [Arthrobacter sp. zg-Y20]
MARTTLDDRPTARTGPAETGELRLHNLVKTFAGPDAAPAVDGIDLVIRPGEFITLLGPSGCGKTTTLRMIAGFEQPTTGQLTLDGEDMVNLTPDKRPMSMVFQSYALFPHMSVFDNVAYGLRLKKTPAKTLEQEVNFALASMSLSPYADRAPNQLSGGQQQRVALARAMVMKPKVLLFDEPLSNLDAKLRVQMRTEIRSLQHKLGITSVYVTHDQDEAMTLSDRIVVMRQGRIEQVAAPTEVYRRPASVFVADFIGRANFIDIQEHVVSGTAGDKMAKVTVLGSEYLVPAHDAVTDNSAATLLVRPESVAVTKIEPAASDVERQVSGRVGRVLNSVFYGSWIEYDVESEAGNVTSVVSDPAPEDLMEAGTYVHVDINPDRSWLMLPEQG